MRIFVASIFFAHLVFAANEEEKSPFSASAVLSNALGVGTLLSGYAKVPQWTTSLTLSPEYRLPSFYNFNQMSLLAEFSLTSWWLDSYYTSSFDANHRVNYSDVLLELYAPKILDVKSANFSLSPYLDVLLPISPVSRTLNRLVGFGVGSSATFKLSDFSFSWAPAFSTWVYSGALMTAPCDEWGSKPNLPPVVNPQNINFDLDQYLNKLVVVPNQNVGSDGICQVAGRQSIGLLVNTAKVAWSKKGHSLSASLGWYINFLRPLADKPELRGEHASEQGFTEATLGKIAYSYQIPVSFDLSISAGVISYQAAFSKEGKLQFPFFDFVTPGKNQTEFFLQLTAGI